MVFFSQSFWPPWTTATEMLSNCSAGVRASGVLVLALSPLVVFGAGAQMLGELSLSGIGKAMPQSATRGVAKSAGDLRESCELNNRALLGELREDTYAEALLKQAWADAALGRMSEPCKLQCGHLKEWLLHPRFSALKETEDGGTKACSLPLHRSV